MQPSQIDALIRETHHDMHGNGDGNGDRETADADRLYLAEIAARLAAWPTSNPVMRAALDRARDAVLQLASDA